MNVEIARVKTRPSLLAYGSVRAYYEIRSNALCVDHRHRENGLVAPPPGISPGALHFSRPQVAGATYSLNCRFIWITARITVRILQGANKSSCRNSVGAL